MQELVQVEEKMINFYNIIFINLPHSLREALTKPFVKASNAAVCGVWTDEEGGEDGGSHRQYDTTNMHSKSSAIVLLTPQRRTGRPSQRLLTRRLHGRKGIACSHNPQTKKKNLISNQTNALSSSAFVRVLLPLRSQLCDGLAGEGDGVVDVDLLKQLGCPNSFIKDKELHK